MILFLILKNNSLIKLLFLVFLIIVLILCGILREEDRTRQVFSVPVANKVIVLDAGHGGFDAGASDHNVVEKDINLKVALRLREFLEQGGAIVFLTRESDESTAEENTDGRNAKKSDLIARKKLAETSDADIFVSIHMNKFPDDQYFGSQVFYGDCPESGKKLGEEIQKGLKDILQDSNTRKAKKIDGGVFLLKNTTIPSVIVECGFLSNPQEAKLLSNEEYQQKLAWGIYLGIVRYFNSATE